MPQPSHDSDYLGRLQDYFAAHRSLPSFSHMARLLGLRSVSSAHAVAGRLKLAGFLAQAASSPAQRLHEASCAAAEDARRAVFELGHGADPRRLARQHGLLQP